MVTESQSGRSLTTKVLIQYCNKKSATITPIVNSFMSILLERCCGVTGSMMLSETVLDDAVVGFGCFHAMW